MVVRVYRVCTGVQVYRVYNVYIRTYVHYSLGLDTIYTVVYSVYGLGNTDGILPCSSIPALYS